jgi:hypothetical protein
MEQGIVTKSDTQPDVREQERTRLAKEEFMQWWERTRGVVSVCCDKAQISRQTYYRWLHDDPEFAARIRAMETKRNDEVEDVLMGLIHIQKHAPSVHFYLQSQHPRYKPKMKLEGSVVVGTVSLQDLLRQDAIEQLKKEGYADPNETKALADGGSNTGKDAEQPHADRRVAENKG